MAMAHLGAKSGMRQFGRLRSREYNRSEILNNFKLLMKKEKQKKELDEHI